MVRLQLGCLLPPNVVVPALIPWYVTVTTVCDTNLACQHHTQDLNNRSLQSVTQTSGMTAVSTDNSMP